ncbi:MAG: hypothetical protein QHC79_09765 [Pseudosphingobacterium sp.]|nr:hypothetical protein [Pseudosphingobacterium sp.]
MAEKVITITGKHNTAPNSADFIETEHSLLKSYLEDGYFIRETHLIPSNNTSTFAITFILTKHDD